MTIPMMNLGPKGVVTDPREKLRIAYTHGFLADKSQSTLHETLVFSFQYISALYGKEPATHARELVSAFTEYLLRLFPEGVEVTCTEDSPGQVTRYVLNLDATVTEDGENYSLGESLFVDDASLVTALNLAID